MTFLELVQKLWQESGSTGSEPDTVVNQTGSAKQLVDWVADAYKDIIGRHSDWGWLHETLTFETVQAQAVYPFGTGAGTVGVERKDWKSWIPDSGRKWLTAVGTNSETFLPPENYWQWRNIYQFGANRNAYSAPLIHAIAPDESICLGPVPLSGYTVQMDYYRAINADLSADDDVPDMPEEFHIAIMWRALMHYAEYESAPEVYDRAANNFNDWVSRLESKWGPRIGWGGTLA